MLSDQMSKRVLQCEVLEDSTTVVPLTPLSGESAIPCTPSSHNFAVPLKGRHGRSGKLISTESARALFKFTKTKECVTGFQGSEHKLNKLAEQSRHLRRLHFTDVGDAVTDDEHGWPSVAALFNHPRGNPVTMHSIEQFQRHSIFPQLKETAIHIIYVQGALRKLVSMFLRGSMGCLRRKSRADRELLKDTMAENALLSMFTEYWGAEMLRRPRPAEDTYGLSNPVICDTNPYLQGLEIKADAWLEPCKIYLNQTLEGLRLYAITTNDQTYIAPGQSGSTVGKQTWEWAQRMAISCAITCHQLAFHLVDHMAMEAVISLCYKFLTAEHFVFKFLEPLCGDVGFLNRTWGIELITGIVDPWGHRARFTISDALPLTDAGALACVARGKKLHAAGQLFRFDKGGYLTETCGVDQSTPFPYRDAAMKVFVVASQFAQAIVDEHWQEEDEHLQRWWQELWFGHLACMKRELSKENLVNVLAQLSVVATYGHDVSHSRWVAVNHPFHVLTLRQGSADNPMSYMPTTDQHMRTRFVIAGLMSDDLETPLNCYRIQFPELGSAVAEFENGLKSIAQTCRHIDKFGSMTH